MFYDFEDIRVAFLHFHKIMVKWVNIKIGVGM